MDEKDVNPKVRAAAARDATRVWDPLLQTVLDSLTHPFYVINVADYSVQFANQAAIDAHEGGPTTCYVLTHNRESPCEGPEHPCPLEIIKKTRKPAVVEHIHYDEENRPRYVDVHGLPIFDEQGRVAQIIEYAVDVTEQKQMLETHQWNQAVNRALAELADALIDVSVSIEKVADLVLEQARRLTASDHGYVSSIDQETRAMAGHTLTHMMGAECGVQAARQTVVFPPLPDGRYPGLWGHALNTGQGFYTNDPCRHPASGGLPEGHIALRNFLAAPALVGGEVVGEIALANSARDYCDRQLQAVTRMATLYALAVQRRRNEMALRASEERYVLAQKAARIGSWDWNMVTGKLIWSDAIEPMFGFERGEFAGTYEAFLSCLHIEDRQMVVDSVNACVQRGDEYGIEHRIVWPDGSVRWISETGDVIRDAEGTAIRMLGIVQDITERKQAQQRAYDLAKFASENPSPVLRIRKEGVVTYANPPGQELLRAWNVKQNQTLSSDWRELTAEALASGRSRIVEVEVAGRILSLAVVPVAEADYVNLYGRDVTEQKEAEHEIRQLNANLEQRVLERTRELTAANRQLSAEIEERKRLESEIIEISEREQRRIGRELHDSLGQQLTGIAIMSKVLQQKLQGHSPEDATRAADISRLINEAISETRQLSRGLHPVSLNENGLMTALQTLSATTRSVFGISCDFLCDEPVLVHDTGMAVHLYRIAQEAVTNAVRHGETKAIVLALRSEGTRARLSIENDGRPFPKKLPENGGMGLRVMHYRAAMIGGILDVQKGPEGGTRVTCVFERRTRRREEVRKNAPKD